MRCNTRKLRSVVLHLILATLLALPACDTGGGGSSPDVDPLAPCGLTYSEPAATYVLGQIVTPNVPTSGCGAPDQFAVYPPLPEGILLDADTGAIYGLPTQVSPGASYQITASNSAGVTTTTVTIAVNPVAPCDLQYSDPVVTYVVGPPITPNVPTHGCGQPDNYFVWPPLPSGLELDGATGIMSGTPDLEVPTMEYLVTATNATGSAMAIITITVISPPAVLAPHEAYRGPKLNTDRYGHTATVLNDGRALIVGGSDERFLTSLDTAEIFDRTLFQSPVPESGYGDFVDTDIDGDPIVMQNGGRIFHTATLLPDGNVLICGGSPDVLIAEATANSEIFDVASRTFAPDFLQIQDELVLPRFRHTATLLPNGKVLIVGGQLSVQETIIDPNFPPGSPFFQIDVEVFPSTESIEIFDPGTRTFTLATDLAGVPAELATPRGRAGHGTAALAGIDDELGTSDDILVHVGGFTTLSAIFAPQFKTPGQFVTEKLTTVEYFEPATGINTSAQNMFLERRVNDAVLLNSGEFEETTPGGVQGVANVLLVTNGDDDRAGSANCFTSVIQSEVVIATFTGLGPANGIQLTGLAEPTQLLNFEGVTFDPVNCTPIGRTGAPATMLRNERTYNGQIVQGNWALTTGGSWLFPTPGGCAEVMFGTCLNEIAGVQFFDPFYNASVTPPWDLSATVGPLNPTGIVGTWLNGDAAIPDDSLAGFADGSALVMLNKERVLHTLSRIPGLDGLLGTLDDRVLVVGGGSSFFPNLGDETVSISSEIYVQP